MNKPNVQPNQEITIISKGIRHYSYTPEKTYIDESEIGRTSFMLVTKVGTTYVYGKWMHFEEDGRKEFTWEDKINPQEYVILDGIRQALKAAYTDRKRFQEDYDKIYQAARYEIERKHNEEARKELDQWQKTFPRPQPLDLKELPYFNMKPTPTQTR